MKPQRNEKAAAQVRQNIPYHGVTITTLRPLPTNAQTVIVKRWEYDSSVSVFVVNPSDGDWLAAVKRLIDADTNNTHNWFGDMNGLVYSVSLPGYEATSEAVCVFAAEFQSRYQK